MQHERLLVRSLDTCKYRLLDLYKNLFGRTLDFFATALTAPRTRFTGLLQVLFTLLQQRGDALSAYAGHDRQPARGPAVLLWRLLLRSCYRCKNLAQTRSFQRNLKSDGVCVRVRACPCPAVFPRENVHSSSWWIDLDWDQMK